MRRRKEIRKKICLVLTWGMRRRIV